MAAALLDHHAKGKIHVRSAGSWPSSYQPAPEGLTAATSPQKGEANAPSRRDTQP
jgi:hypothetical protein